MSGGKLRRGRSTARAKKTTNDDDVSSAPPLAPPPAAAPNPSSSASTSTADMPGASVSTSTDVTPWSVITASSPHSRRAVTDAEPIIARRDKNITTATDAPDATPQRRGAIDFSAHPNLDLSDDIEGGTIAPTTRGVGSVGIIPPPTGGDGASTTTTGGDGTSTTTSTNAITDLFAELDILRRQANNFQLQLDIQRGISSTFATSITNIETSLQTLRSATTSNADMISRAITIADAATTTVQECRTATSDLTYQFHVVSRKVDDFMETQRAHPLDSSTALDPPPALTSSVETAFQEADAALSEGISTLERELGSSLDQNISSRLASSSSGGTRFSNVRDRWSSRAPHDSEAAYAAAHTPSAAASTTTIRVPDGGNGDGNGSPHSFGDGLTPRYNGPSSPRHRNALMRGLHPDILLWHAGGKLGDPVCGCTFMEEEDVEALDILPELAVGIAEDHLDIVENWTNPRWAQKDVRDFQGRPDGYSAPSTGGPHTHNILKQISTWDKLSDLSPMGWQAFYNRLRRFCFKWHIALMPFEAINLKYECFGHALCTCGLGLDRWKRMGDALFLVLEYLLPTTNTIISTNMDTLANGATAANGYELLWILLKEFIPMFDRSKPAIFPTWKDSDDIFQFARLLLMYCTMCHHRGQPYSEAMKSRMFLSNIRGQYTSLATQYSAIVGTYCPG